MEAQRIAVLAPGANYPAAAPLLFYARLAVERRGGEVRPITWRLPQKFDDTQHRIDVVRGQVAEAVGDDNPLVIGKSLGSLSAGFVAEHALHAVWLTPLLTLPEVVEEITAAEYPPLLIGGSADKLWDGATARRISPHVLEIPGADHALHVPGPVSATTAVAGQVADAIDAFIGDLVWPN